MADPYADLAELKTINQERETAGLPRFRDIVEARKWKAEPKVEVEQPKAEEVQQPEVKNDEPIKSEDAPPQVVIPAAAKPDASHNAEIAELRRQLQAVKTEEGRVAKLDKLLKESEARAADAERRAQESELKVQEAVNKSRGDDALALLTPEERDEISPTAMSVIQKIVSKFVKDSESSLGSEIRATRQTIEERRLVDEQREEAERERAANDLQSRVSDMWERKISAVIPSSVYSAFESNPKWEEWKNKPSYGTTRFGLFSAAVNSLDHEAVIEQLKNFMGFAGIEIPAKGNKPPLRADEIRGSQVTEQPTKAEFYEGEYNRIVNDYAAGKMPTGWSDNKLRDYIEKGREARFQGRMKPGFRPR